MPEEAGADLAHEVIQSIVSLTEQRDQRSLEQSLLTTLEEMFPGAEGWLANIPATPSGETECTLLHGDPTTLPGPVLEAGLTQLDETGFSRASHAGRDYLTVRLRAAGDRRGHLLVLTQATWREVDLQVVQGMTRVYQNFVNLLFDSEKDTLTGLYNRRKLEMRFREIAAAPAWGRRQKDQITGDYLAIMDLDRFKRINDSHGHLIGDEVLLAFANILRHTLRDSDQIFRYGGEEFVALLKEAPNDSIEEILERVRGDVEAHDFPLVGKVTVSIGFARLDGCFSPLEVMAKADRALYFAKDHGRNQVREFESLVNQHLLEDIHRDGGVELF
jgi:diguanylate cyclase (GGDEF)-like protein